MMFRCLALVLGLAVCVPAHAVGVSALIGTWEAARSPEDERLYIRLMEKGKAEIIAEYDFQLPNMPGKRRGRSTTFARWTVKGDDVTVTYAKVRDRLRYHAQLPLDEIGEQGKSAALKPTGKSSTNTRLPSTLWKAPHDYKLKAAQSSASAAPAPVPQAQDARN